MARSGRFSLESTPKMTALQLREEGLDVIVVHGVVTSGIPQPPERWNSSFAENIPFNSRVLSYDCQLDVSKEMKWQAFEQESAGLLQAISQEYQAHPKKNRSICFVGYWMSGIAVMKTLYDMTQQSIYMDIVERVRGMVYLATPRITENTVGSLVSVHRGRPYRDPPLLPDFQRFCTYYRKFTETELARRCPTLVCYETIEMKAPSLIGRLISRKVPRVEKALVAEVPKGDEYHVVPIDCDLRDIFSSTQSTIFPKILDFLRKIPHQGSQIAATKDLPIDDWVDVQDPPQAAISPNTSEATNRKGSNTRLEVTKDERQSSDPSSLLSASSASSTVRAVSLSSAESGYMFVSTHQDILIRSPVVCMQNQVYESENSDFQGRRDLITTMMATLSPASTDRSFVPRTCVLYGPGGMGKTQTALKYFHENKKHFDVSLWLQGNNAESLLNGYHKAACELGLNPKISKAQQPEYNVKQLLDWLHEPLQQPSNPRSKRLNWLMVFDNVDDNKVLNGFWPSKAHGSVIITTRDPIISERRTAPGVDLKVGCLSREDAIVLLRKKLPASLLSGETEANLARLAKVLSCWPLAIVQIAGKMERLRQSPSRFLSKYQKEEARYIYYDQMEHIEDNYETPLSALWSLRDMERKVARMISVISLLLPDSIPEFVLEDTGDHADLSDYPTADEYDLAISQLEKQSIVTRATPASKAGREVSIHSVIQEVIRAQLLRNMSSFIEVFNSTVRLLLAFWDFQSIPTTQYKELAVAEKSRWDRCNTLLPHMGHVRAMFELVPDTHKRECATERFFYMMNEVGWHHVLQRSLDEALDWANATLRYFDICCPEEFPMLRACQYATLSAVARSQNRPLPACEAYEKCFRINLEVYRKTKTITSQLVAAYTELGRVLIMKGDLDAAENKIQESIRLRKAMPNFKRIQLYSPIIFTSYIQVLRGQYKDAEEQLLMALKDREEEYKVKDDVISKRSGHILYCLGNVLTKALRFDEGYHYFRRSFAVFQETGGESDLDFAIVCYQLARCHLRDHLPDPAQQIIDRAIETFAAHKYFEAYHARALFIKSKILHQKGAISDAQEVETRAVQIRSIIIPEQGKVIHRLTEQDFDDLIPVWHR